jgi:tRNA (guanine-N7-)-methyltransferase
MHPASAILSPKDWADRLPIDHIFENPQCPLEVDIGCGKGRFLLARAKANPRTNFLGVDRLIKRLQKIDIKIAQEGLYNVRLLHLDAGYVVEQLLPPASVSMFHIFFSDPWPKRRHHRRRLFSSVFVNALGNALVLGGQANIATDHLEYFAEIVKMFQGDARFVETPVFQPSVDEQTNFEVTFLEQGTPIGRCSFKKAKSEPIPHSVQVTEPHVSGLPWKAGGIRPPCSP